MTEILLETRRLQIRRITGLDVGEMMTVYGDQLAMGWVDDGQPVEEVDCRCWISVTLDNYARRGYGMFAVKNNQDCKRRFISVQGKKVESKG